jgi:hypothetical protein
VNDFTILSIFDTVILGECLVSEITFQDVDVGVKIRETARSYPDSEIASYFNRLLLVKAFSPYIRALDVDVAVEQAKLHETSEDWVRLRPASNQDAKDVMWEHARWIESTAIERWLASSLSQSSIDERRMIERSLVEQRDLVLASSDDVVAIVRENGDFHR